MITRTALALFVGGLAHGTTAHVPADWRQVDMESPLLKAGRQRYILHRWAPSDRDPIRFDLLAVNSFVPAAELEAQVRAALEIALRTR